MSELLLKNVTPIPALEHSVGTVSILLSKDGIILRVTTETIDAPNAKVIDLENMFVCPGWIDLHTHVYYGATDISVKPEAIGLATGVTTLVDTGSSGEANFHGFREYIADRAKEQIFAFLNIGSIGLVACNRVSEIQGIGSIDFNRTLRVVDENRDLIKGIKIRASHVITGGWGITPLKLAKKLSRITNLPLMVHVGEPPPLLEEVFENLDEGDIVTHCFNGKAGGNILDDTHALTAAKACLDRGIIFDVGHGGASFSYDLAERAIANGIKPHSISTDLHDHNIRGPVFDLSTTMSKLLAVGLSLEEVIHAVTFAPATVLGLALTEASWLSQGTQAKLTIFELSGAHVEVLDSDGVSRTLETRIMPRYSVFRGDFIEANSRFDAASTT